MRNTNFFIFFLCLLFSFAVQFCAEAADSLPLYQWVSFGPEQTITVRTIMRTPNDPCPQILLAGIKINMSVRHPVELETKNYFPLRICQAVLPLNTTKALINHQSLALPVKDPQKIVIFMNTGIIAHRCREFRHCALHKIIRQAAKFNPDLVIHLGNYLFSSPSSTQPILDNWEHWEKDFFKPFNSLLSKAPWIFVRGNQEVCTHFGNGWNKLLDPFTFKHCFNYSPLYTINLGEINLFILDASNAEHKYLSENEISWYENYFRQIAEDKNSYTNKNWLISHAPIGILSKNKSTSQLFTLQNAWQNINPQNIELLLSTSLLGIKDAKISEKNICYFTLEKNNVQWDIKFYQLSGKMLARCTLSKKQLICPKE